MRKLIAVIAMELVVVTAFGDVDSLGKTPRYWYSFDGAMLSRGEHSLSSNFDSTYSFPVCRDEKRGFSVKSSGTGGWGSSFAPNNQSFTIFVSLDPGNLDQRIVFALGGRNLETNIAITVLHGGRVGVATWNKKYGTSNPIVQGVLATDGRPGKLHPYAIVYDSSKGKIALYSAGVKCGATSFSGFGGNTGSATDYCFGCIYGGAWKPYVQCNGTSDDPVLEDFRFYTEALTDSDVEALSNECPSQWTEEEIASIVSEEKQPQYWYTFDGKVRSLGADDFIRESWSDQGGTYLPPTPVSYQICRPGVLAGCSPEQSRGDMFLHGNGSFTVFLSSTIGVRDNAALFSLGSNASASGLALARASASSVKLVAWQGGASGHVILAEAYVTEPVQYVHPYAIRYDAESRTVALCADGIWSTPVSFSGFSGLTSYQLRGLYGGEGHGLYGGSDESVWEDFRFYHGALSNAEIDSLSQEMICGWSGYVPYDIAVRPKYWYTFAESEAIKRGTDEMWVGYSWDAKKFGMSDTGVFARKGSFAATALVKKYSEKMFDATQPFTVFISARGALKDPVYKERGILFSMGANGSDANLALNVSKGGSIYLSRWEHNPTKRIDIIGPLAGYNAMDFNAYAIVWDGTDLRFYINGLGAGSSKDFNPAQDKCCAFGSIYNGNEAWMDDGLFAIEDFRFYAQALTSAEVAKIAARFPAWPNGALVWRGGESGTWDTTSANWYSWDETNWTAVKGMFAGNDSALFDTPLTSLDVADGVEASSVRFEADAILDFNANTPIAASVVIADGASVVPIGVEGLKKPGVVCFKGVTDVSAPEKSDAFGNVWYLDGAKLCYGRIAPGFFLLLQ